MRSFQTLTGGGERLLLRPMVLHVRLARAVGLMARLDEKDRSNWLTDFRMHRLFGAQIQADELAALVTYAPQDNWARPCEPLCRSGHRTDASRQMGRSSAGQQLARRPLAGTTKVVEVGDRQQSSPKPCVAGSSPAGGTESRMFVLGPPPSE